MVQTKKLGAECNEETYDLVVKASAVDRRSKSDFIRIACIEKAEKVLDPVKNKDGIIKDE